MRKFSLALLVMMVAGVTAYAQTYSPVVDFEAEAQSIFGVNLDDGTTGFEIKKSADLSITFVAEDTAEFGSGQVFGYLKVEDFKVETDDGALVVTDGDVEAKLFLGPAYIVIATAENGVNVAGTQNVLDTSILEASSVHELGNQGVSVALGFAVPDLLSIEAVVASQTKTPVLGDDDDDDIAWDTNTNNSYKLALLTEFTVDALTITLEAASWVNRTLDDGATADFGEPAIVGVGLEYALPLNDMMTLTPFVGFDYYSDGTNADFEVIGGVKLTWPGTDDDVDMFGEEDVETLSGVGIDGGYATTNDGANNQWFARLALHDPTGMGGLIPVLGVNMLAEVSGNNDDAEGLGVAFAAELKADLGTLVPYFGLITANQDLDDSDFGLTLRLGTDIKVIDNVTFGIDYKSGNLLQTADAAEGPMDGKQVYNYAAVTDGIGGTNAKSGQLLISTKIAY